MKITYDPKYNIAYISFREKGKTAKTLPLSDEVNVDISSDGKVYGIELLNAKTQLQVGARKEFIFTNEAVGKATRVSLSGV